MAIKAEHCLESDSHDKFTTSNTGITTTPYSEYWFVVGKDAHVKDGGVVPLEQEQLLEDGRNNESLIELMEKKECKEAEITWEECLALRLYTGPMFMVRILPTLR